MNNTTRATLAAASSITLAALLAACGGGGGGGGSTTPPGAGGGTPPPPQSTPTSSPTPPPSATGSLTLNGSALANATVVFSCGCNQDGGKLTTDANGNYTISGSAPAVSGNGTYTADGNNLMIVGYANGSATQVWTMEFLGATPAHDLNLSSTPNNASANVSDTAATAAALYVYYQASQLPTTDKTFDWFNFNTVAAFAQHLRTSPNASEQQFLSDITAAQAHGASLFPVPAPWNAVSSDGTSFTMNTDIKTVQASGDSALPTPCPSANGCTGAPTP